MTRPTRYRGLRIGWALLSLLIAESVIFGLAVLPAALFWAWHFRWGIRAEWIRVVVLAMSFIPAYVIFALALMGLTGLATRLLGWRTPADVELEIASADWPLLDWARYMIATHLVRVFAGSFFRATPVWTWFHRWNGARVGRGVYVNSLALADHNLLELGDDVVIGSDVHLSGHTVEGGVLKTAGVRIGRGVTIGTGSVLGIGVEIGDGARIGALSFIPKFRTLEPGSVHVGARVQRIDEGGAAETGSGPDDALT